MNESGNQEDLKERIKGNKIQLRHALQEKEDGESKTVARTLLEDAINGHKLILKELDEYLVEGPIKSEEETKKQEVTGEVAPTNLNAEDYHITIDLKGILPEKGATGPEG